MDKDLVYIHTCITRCWQYIKEVPTDESKWEEYSKGISAQMNELSQNAPSHDAKVFLAEIFDAAMKYTFARREK